jgi:predicted RNA-binding protein YlqC (UPF0109 family)
LRSGESAVSPARAAGALLNSVSPVRLGFGWRSGLVAILPLADAPPVARGCRAMAELLAELARRLVDEPDAVRVEEVEGDDGATVLRLHVAEGDVGKVIGRQGRLARALRTIVRAGGVAAGSRLQLEIVG